MQPRLKWLATITTIGMIFLLIGGALVTKTESGDGCGASWPLCHGKFLPTEITPELLIEASHRLVTGVVAIFVVLLFFASRKHLGHIRETKFLAWLMLSFLILQSLIGAATVLWGQSDFFLALHFGISLVSFAAVFLLTLLIYEVDQKFQAKELIIDRKLKFHTISVTIYSFVVVYTGALVRHMDASMVCGSWPLCNNEFFAWPRNIYEWVQMGHRMAAGVIFFWILSIFIMAYKNYRHVKVLFYGWLTTFLLVTAQVTTGALIIFTQLNLYISLLHALFITCLFGLLSYFVFLVSRSNLYEKAVPKKNIKIG